MNKLKMRLKRAMEDFCTGQMPVAGKHKVIVGQTSLGRVYGIVVWSGFDGMTNTQRQDMIWNFLRDKLSDPEDRKNISAIYTRGSGERVAEDELRSISDRRFPAK